MHPPPRGRTCAGRLPGVGGEDAGDIVVVAAVRVLDPIHLHARVKDSYPAPVGVAVLRAQVVDVEHHGHPHRVGRPRGPRPASPHGSEPARGTSLDAPGRLGHTGRCGARQSVRGGVRAEENNWQGVRRSFNAAAPTGTRWTGAGLVKDAARPGFQAMIQPRDRRAGAADVGRPATGARACAATSRVSSAEPIAIPSG